jgi:hypothetical protein
MDNNTMIDLPQVTLLTIDGVGTDINAVKALKYSMKDINFGAIKYITAGDIKPDFCEVHKISKMSYDDYSVFCMTELLHYVNTEYVLIIHPDGFVVNPQLWTDDFLKYDYIGAPWDTNVLIRNTLNKSILHEPLKQNNYCYNIGNGGFCLRSKKLLKEVNNLYSKEYITYPEDAIICITMRKELENRGIKFPNDVKIASKFSCEMIYVDGNVFSSNNSFGFHCDETHRDKFNLLNSVIL